MRKGKSKSKGVQISVSPEAHHVMQKEAFTTKPKKITIRALINMKNNLPEKL